MRNRRLAAAISRLGQPWAYESAILLRTMLEIKINYSWIRLRNSHSRARRFCRFWPLERLRLLEKAASIFRADDYDDRKRMLEQRRRKVRRLFRLRDGTGKMRWARSWAQVESVEARLAEVQKQQNPTGPDLFQYALYVALSSVVHGGPSSLEQVLSVHHRRLGPTRQPESDPQRHVVGALLLLMWTIETFATDAKARRALQPELRDLRSDVTALGTSRKARRRKAAQLPRERELS